MVGVGKECWFIAFNQMSQPCQCKCGRDEQQSDDPMKPDDHNRREPDRYGDHVQGAINRMIVGTVVMGVEARHSPLEETTCGHELYPAMAHVNEHFKNLIGEQASPRRQPDYFLLK